MADGARLGSLGSQREMLVYSLPIMTFLAVAGPWRFLGGGQTSVTCGVAGNKQEVGYVTFRLCAHLQRIYIYYIAELKWTT